MHVFCRSLVIGLAVTSLAADWPEGKPNYRLQREKELAADCVKNGRDVIVGLLHLASDDPERIALGEKMILKRIEIGRIVAFFQQDMTLAYRLYRDKMTPDGRKKLGEWLHEKIKPGSREYGMRFVHANDNWPFVGMQMLILGGESLGKRELADEGVERLETYLDISRELGVGSEYNSPTYNPMSLSAVDSIAALSDDLRTRVVARVIASRLYSEISLRYHAPSTQFGAPHSRAYQHDTLCTGSALRYTLHPLVPSGVLLEGSNFPELVPHDQSIAEECVLRRFFSADLGAVCDKKPFPYLVQARQYSPHWKQDADAMPGGLFDTVTYMTSRYVVGSTIRHYGKGAGNTPFQVHWTRRAPRATEASDVGTLYVRGRMNDEPPILPMNTYSAHAGYVMPVQHRNTTVVLYRPRESASGKMESLSASAMIPRLDLIGSVWVGRKPRKITRLPAERKDPEPVFIKDGDVYLGIVPLGVSNKGRKHGLRVERQTKHLVVSYYNLQADKPETASPKTLATIQNGFVVEVGDKEEFGSFEKFREAINAAKVTDTVAGTVRSVSYERAGRSIAVKQNMLELRLLSRAHEGKPYTGPMLRSPHQAASMDAEVEVGNATLTGPTGEPKFLTAEPTTGRYTALYPSRFSGSLRLETPKGKVACDAFRMGRIHYKPGKPALLVIDCADAPAPLRVTKPSGPMRVILNDEDVTSRAKAVADGMLEIALPGNGKPVKKTELQLSTTASFKGFTGPKRRGGVICKVKNVGKHPACNICIAPYFIGFGRQYGRPDAPRIKELVPGEEKQVSWGLTGTPLGTKLRARAIATSDNAPTVTVDVMGK